MSGTSQRILFVDDESAVLDGIARSHGRAFDIETAAGGEAGLDTLAEGDGFAVVVSDVYMPGMDGFEFLRRVAEEYPAVVRVMLTGGDDLEIGEEALESGLVFRYLCKPIDSRTLREVLQAALAQHAQSQTSTGEV